MELKIKNKHLKDVADFLYNKIALNGKKSIDRMRVVQNLNDRNDKYAEEEMEILKQYAELNEEGEPKPFEGNTFKVNDVKEFQKQQKILQEEEYILNDANLNSALTTLKDAVLNYDDELDGRDAFAHYYLYEQFDQ